MNQEKRALLWDWNGLKQVVVGENLFLSRPDWPIPLSCSAFPAILPLHDTPACPVPLSCLWCHICQTCMLAWRWRQSIPPAFPACFNIGYLSVCLSCLSFLSANHAWLLSTCLANSPSVLLSPACPAVHLACMPNFIPFLFIYPNLSRSFYIPIPFFCSACLLCLPLSCDLFVIYLFLCHLFLAFLYIGKCGGELLPRPGNTATIFF